MKLSDFNALLAKWRGATKASMAHARDLAEASIRHFAETGDVVYCQMFYDAMKASANNYVRKAAFLKWLLAFSPLAMDEDGKMTKDKRESATAFDIEGACKEPFWDFAPDPEQVLFNETDVVKAITGIIKRFKNEDRYKAQDEAAVAVLTRAEAMVSALAVHTPSEPDAAETTEKDVAAAA